MTYEQDSKKRLTTIINKKEKTIMIGALSTFEDVLGFLWDFDSEKEYSSEIEDIIHLLDEKISELGLHREFTILWKFVRDKILNLGNNQIRATNAELQHYTINWNRYVYNMPVKKRGQND